MDWPDCRLELRCPSCDTTTDYPTKLMAQIHGNGTFDQVLKRVRCRNCKSRPDAAYLCAGHREWRKGPYPDWAVQLVIF